MQRLLGARQDVTVEHYDRMTQYPDGRTKMTGGVFKVLQRGGRDFVIKARDAELEGQPPNVDVTLKGAVEIAASDGLVLKTEEATFADGEGVVRAPGPVAFTRSRMSGTAVGHDLRQEPRRAVAARPGRHPHPARRAGQGRRRDRRRARRAWRAPTSTCVSSGA